MTRLIVETENSWAMGKIKGAISIEIGLLLKAVEKTESKISDCENRYGNLANRESLYGKIDDMELLEWEGESETLQKLRQKLNSLEEINFEYK